MNTVLLRIMVLIGYLIMLGINYLAVTLPLAGRDTGEISDSYANLFAPAGYTFSIWGIIYLLLAVYVFYQFGRTKDKLVAEVNKIFVANALLNALWILAWHYDYIGLSLFIMAGLLITLIRIADIIKSNKLTKQERLSVQLPFSVYFGWITIATIANIVIFLVSLGWNGFGIQESIWTTIVLFVGALIGSKRLLIDRSIGYGLVLIWAYGGIVAKHVSEGGYDSKYPFVIYSAILCMIIFIGVIGKIAFVPTKKSKR